MSLVFHRPKGLSTKMVEDGKKGEGEHGHERG